MCACVLRCLCYCDCVRSCLCGLRVFDCVCCMVGVVVCVVALVVLLFYCFFFVVCVGVCVVWSGLLCVLFLILGRPVVNSCCCCRLCSFGCFLRCGLLFVRRLVCFALRARVCVSVCVCFVLFVCL